MTARLVLHVGVHKTGSSLIQTFLRDRSSELGERGMAYLNRTVLDELISQGDLATNDWDGLAAAVDGVFGGTGAELAIISHEGSMGPAFPTEDRSLYSRAAALAPRMAATLGAHPTTVVVAVRPQSDFLESYYLQSIHTGRHQRFDDWLARLDLDRLSWRPLIDHLAAAFGPGNVRVLDFRAIRSGQESYIRRFLELAAPGCDLPVEYDVASNPSISAKGLDLALAANPLLRNQPERRSMRRFLQTNFSNLDYPRPTLLSAELRSQLGARYDAEYDELTRG